MIRPRETCDGKMEDVTLADRIRAQDEMIAALQEGEAKAGGDKRGHRRPKPQ